MRIETAVGPVTVKKLAELSSASKDFSEVVLVWDGRKLSVSQITKIRPIGVEQLFMVRLDDDQEVFASASSRFVTRAGDFKTAPELRIDDSLLPLYLGSDSHGYSTYRIPGRAAKRKLSRLMAEWKLGHALEKGTYVGHIDGNRKNHHPNNLKITVNKDKSTKLRCKHKLVTAINSGQTLLDECAAASPSMAKIVGRKSKGNHKVIGVEPGTLAEVYTASVRSGGFLSVSGVFLELPS